MKHVFIKMRSNLPGQASQNGALLEHFSVGEDMAMEVRLELSLMLELTLMEDTEKDSVRILQNIFHFFSLFID